MLKLLIGPKSDNLCVTNLVGENLEFGDELLGVSCCAKIKQIAAHCVDMV